MKKASIIYNMIETERLILRQWLESDAEALYKYAGDPEVGPPAGWQPHDSVDMSLMVIREVFSAPFTYAVVLKDTGEAIGCCGIVPPEARENVMTTETDAEIGYWIGKPYWGMGLIPESVTALVDFLKKELNISAAWISFNDGNVKSRRVAEKCGFSYHHTDCSENTKEHFYVRKL